jgi:hypothetical protein
MAPAGPGGLILNAKLDWVVKVTSKLVAKKVKQYFFRKNILCDNIFQNLIE